MAVFLKHRQRDAEWMDQPGVDPEALRRSLRYIRWINSALFYTRSMIGHLDRFSRAWPAGRRMEIVDLATGSADVPRAILRWADHRGVDVRLVGVDLHPVTAQMAVEGNDDPRLSIVRGDALNPPFEERSFDYALNALFLHHLDEGGVVRVLREMNRLSRRGVIVADLLRNRRAYAWITLLTLFADEMIRHDARVSVAQAFTREEMIGLRDRAGLDFARYYRHFGHRFILAGEKEV